MIVHSLYTFLPVTEENVLIDLFSVPPCCWKIRAGSIHIHAYVVCWVKGCPAWFTMSLHTANLITAHSGKYFRGSSSLRVCVRQKYRRSCKAVTLAILSCLLWWPSVHMMNEHILNEYRNVGFHAKIVNGNALNRTRSILPKHDITNAYILRPVMIVIIINQEQQRPWPSQPPRNSKAVILIWISSIISR